MIGFYDLTKAREIHRQYIRDIRRADLTQLDIDYLRADEVGDLAAKQTIAQQKQVLRDLPDDPRIDQASTIEELAALSYSVLKG